MLKISAALAKHYASYYLRKSLIRIPDQTEATHYFWTPLHAVTCNYCVINSSILRKVVFATSTAMQQLEMHSNDMAVQRSEQITEHWSEIGL